MRNLIRIVESSNERQPQALNAQFRIWFGQSKVVSPNGAPLMVYHGSNSHAYSEGEINVFQTLPSSGRGAAFFTSSRSLAGEYGEKVYAVYLRMENPLIVFGNGKSWTTLDHTTKIAGRVTDQLRAHHRKQAKELDDIFRDLASIDGEDPSDTPTASKIPDHVDQLDQYHLNILPGVDQGTAETDTIVKQARRMGYDGVIFKDINDSPTTDRSLYKNTPSDVFAVFRAGQVKSVYNNGEWDVNDPDINQ